ncbi:MAG: hypothetical protein NTX25_03100 [Proteobacteria bacterium]|nr:hypothetical protein [Pseudomonadota bacterium]
MQIMYSRVFTNRVLIAAFLATSAGLHAAVNNPSYLKINMGVGVSSDLRRKGPIHSDEDNFQLQFDGLSSEIDSTQPDQNTRFKALLNFDATSPESATPQDDKSHIEKAYVELIQPDFVWLIGKNYVQQGGFTLRDSIPADSWTDTYRKYFLAFRKSQTSFELKSTIFDAVASLQITNDVNTEDSRFGEFNGSYRQPAWNLQVSDFFNSVEILTQGGAYDINHSYYFGGGMRYFQEFFQFVIESETNHKTLKLSSIEATSGTTLASREFRNTSITFDFEIMHSHHLKFHASELKMDEREHPIPLGLKRQGWHDYSLEYSVRSHQDTLNWKFRVLKNSGLRPLDYSFIDEPGHISAEIDILYSIQLPIGNRQGNGS